MRYMIRGTIAATVLTFVAASAAAAQHAGAHWTYTGEDGPNHWGALSPEYAACSQGTEQSPIDIASATPAAGLGAIQFDYKPSTLRVIDNGHTIMVTPGPGSSITVGGTQYALKQFHFHHPSEEEIKGKRHAMVIHFVHADSADHLAVIAVLLDVGAENPMLRRVWSHLPTMKNVAVTDSVMIDPAALLPAARGYYTFAGSLTTPPCSEHVTWFVLKDPVTISTSQEAAFAALYAMNARPVQPLHGRTIKETP